MALLSIDIKRVLLLFRVAPSGILGAGVVPHEKTGFSGGKKVRLVRAYSQKVYLAIRLLSAAGWREHGPVNTNHGARAAGLVRKRAVPQFCSGRKVYATDFFSGLPANAGLVEAFGGLENSKAPSSNEDHFRLIMSRK
jgi:hypothetical protein